MAYLANLTAWISAYGPVAWGFVGLIKFATVIGLYWVWSYSNRLQAITRLYEERERTTAVNPLDGVFNKRRLRLIDFFDPFYQPISTARFTDCQLHGPANMFAMGCQFLSGSISIANLLRLRPKKKL